MLYAQMVKAGLVGAAEIVALDMDAVIVTGVMLERVTDREQRAGPMQDLFRKLTEATLARLFADRAFAADLTPAFMRRLLGDMTEVKVGIAGLSAKLDSIAAQPRDVLEALAARFEIARVYALGDAELREALEKRAEDYRAYRAQIEAIDERTAGLGNLKAAARDAAERLDFDEVEALLAQVDEVETEVAAETKVLRADNAPLRGRVDVAFLCLSAAADGFASIDPVEPGHRRLEYANRLYLNGFRYGGVGLEFAERMLREGIHRTPMNAQNVISALKINLGLTLTALGVRHGGTMGIKMLKEAILVVE